MFNNHVFTVPGIPQWPQPQRPARKTYHRYYNVQQFSITLRNIKRIFYQFTRWRVRLLLYFFAWKLWEVVSSWFIYICLRTLVFTDWRLSCTWLVTEDSAHLVPLTWCPDLFKILRQHVFLLCEQPSLLCPQIWQCSAFYPFSPALFTYHLSHDQLILINTNPTG